MSYKPLHPPATVTIRRTTRTPVAGGADRETQTTIGSGAPGVENGGGQLRQLPDGTNARIEQILYWPFPGEPGARIGDQADFTDPSTGEVYGAPPAASLLVADRVGPWNVSDDHVELFLRSALDPAAS